MMKDRLQCLIHAASYNDCRGMETITIQHDDATCDYIITIGKGPQYFGKSIDAAFNQFEQGTEHEASR